MAVTLPSDLVMDVMRGADPARLRMATARLSANSDVVPHGTSAFAELMKRPMPKPAVSYSPLDEKSMPLASVAENVGALKAGDHFSSQGTAPSQPYIAFERMFLRNMFEHMLPSAESGIYGGDMTSGVWRSMVADQLGGVYAAAGGIGLAESLVDRQSDVNVSNSGQWPYFEANPIRSFVG